MRQIFKRLSNTGTILSIASLIILILTVNGVGIDDSRVMTTVKALCGIGILLGVLNNPTTPGIDNLISKEEVK